MKVYPTPENEIERLRVLNMESRYFSEKEYESITQLAPIFVVFEKNAQRH
jgi:hypothetical protein